MECYLEEGLQAEGLQKLIQTYRIEKTLQWPWILLSVLGVSLAVWGGRSAGAQETSFAMDVSGCVGNLRTDSLAVRCEDGGERERIQAESEPRTRRLWGTCRLRPHNPRRPPSPWSRSSTDCPRLSSGLGVTSLSPEVTKLCVGLSQVHTLK